jgi:transcriptional repressor NrdR
MQCPFCRAPDSRVIDSRLGREGDVVRRRRHCDACARRFTTYERVDAALPMVVKKDGRREPFDRKKIVGGLARACEKRPVSVDTIEALASGIERRLLDRGDKEVQSAEIGGDMMSALHDLDEVAYVRFASVYRSFRDVHEFMRELEELIAVRQAAAKETKRRTPARPRKTPGRRS